MTSEVRRLAYAVSTVVLSALWAGPLAAQQIHTGSPDGVYQARLCPILKGELAKAQLQYTCASSPSASETFRKIDADPRDIGYVRLDLLALELEKGGAKDRFVVMRSDDARECLFLATRNKQFSSFGDVQAYADKVRFILPPKDSGDAATFAFLQQIDPDGLGRVKDVTYAESAEAAVRQALSAEDTLALFVALPDPSTAIFKDVAKSGGQMLPVIDRTILRQQVGGRKVYFAEETEVAQADWVKRGRNVVTACTPIALITGDPSRVSGDKARQDQKDVIATVEKLKSEDLVPPQSLVQRLLKRTRELSAVSVEKMIDLSEKARVEAGPALDKAKEASERAYEKAKEATKEAMDKAREALEKGTGKSDPGTGGSGGSGAPSGPPPKS